MDGVSTDNLLENLNHIIGKLILLLLAIVSAYASWANDWAISVLSIAFPTIIIAGILIVIEMEKITNNIAEIVGKLVFIAAASVAVIALAENNWNIRTLVISLPTIILSGILIFLDFEELRFFIYEKTGFEIIRPDTTETVELTRGYDQLVELASRESGELALNLRRVQTNMNSSDPFEALSDVIEDGISSNPIDETVDHLRHLLNIRDYIEDPSRSRLEIITLSGDDLLAESDGSGVDPIKGITFKLHADISITERGETRHFDKVVAKAKLTEISGEVYELSIYSWDSGGEADISELKSTLMDRDPYLEVNKGGLENIDWGQLENSHKFLKSVSTMEATNAA